MSRRILLSAPAGLGWPVLLTALVMLFLPGSFAVAADPLSAKIDTLILERHIGPVADRCSDSDFMRRVYLDLNGIIPTSTEARVFLDDTSPDKRMKLIDRLLSHPRYARHMANIFDLMLMERRPDKHIKSPEWQQYLHQSLVANKPYNQLAREILGADGVDPKLRPAAKFYLDRDAEVNLLTRDVSRIFFGKDLQCAQCHDHPLIDNYKQRDYYGVYAFFNRSSVFTDKKQKKSFLAEKADGAVSFESVFTGDAGKSRPRLPGETELLEPVFVPGDDYTVKPAKEVRSVPKYSRRARLGETATTGTNRAFNRNIVNRLWAHMMGRGLVHPVDYHHPDNPPSHPELLDLLADEFVTMKYDIKAFLKDLALSETYQRSFELPDGITEKVKIAAKQVSVLQDEQKKLEKRVEESLAASTAVDKELEPFQKSTGTVQAEYDKALAVVAAAQKVHDVPTKAVSTAQGQLAAKQGIIKVVTEVATKTRDASQKLPNEKELTAALQTLEAKLKQLSTEAGQLQKTVDQKIAAAKPTADKLEVTRQAAAKIIPRLTAAQKAEAPARQKIASVETRSKEDQTTAKTSEQLLTALVAYVEYGNLTKNQSSIKNTIVTSQTQLTAQQQALAKQTAEMKKNQQELAKVQKAAKQAAQTLASAQQQLSKHKQIADAVSTATAKMKVALAQIPGNKDLAQATLSVQKRSGQLNEQLTAMQKQVTAGDTQMKSATGQLNTMKETVARTTIAVNGTQKNMASISSQLTKARSESKAVQTAAEESFGKVTEQWTNSFVIGAIRPVPAESLAWSFLQSTGMSERQKTAEESALKKKDAKAWETTAIATREVKLEEAVHKKMKGNVGLFVKLFGAGPGQPQDGFFATVDQALFLSNAGQVRGWLNPSGGNLTDRLNKLEDPQAMAEELYLSVFTRRPTPAEVDQLKQYMAKRSKDRVPAIQEIVWALLTSTEFRFNH